MPFSKGGLSRVQITGYEIVVDYKSDTSGIEWKMADYRSFLGTSNFLAPNAPSGLLVDYYVKSAGPVRAVITDSKGATVRTLNGRAEAGVVNRLTSDMR